MKNLLAAIAIAPLIFGAITLTGDNREIAFFASTTQVIDGLGLLMDLPETPTDRIHDVSIA